MPLVTMFGQQHQLTELEAQREFMYGEIAQIEWAGDGKKPDSVFAKHKLEALFEDEQGVMRGPTAADVGTEAFENFRAWLTDFLMDKAQDYEQREILSCSPARICLIDGTWL